MVDEVSVDTFAQQLPDKYVRCRELGHVWRPSTARWVPSETLYERVLRCTSCRTEKVQLVNRHGHIISSVYRYAANYLAQHVTGLAGGARDVYRLEAITRWIDASKQQTG